MKNPRDLFKYKFTLYRVLDGLPIGLSRFSNSENLILKNRLFDFTFSSVFKTHSRGHEKSTNIVTFGPLVTNASRPT